MDPFRFDVGVISISNALWPPCFESPSSRLFMSASSSASFAAASRASTAAFALLRCFSTSRFKSSPASSSVSPKSMGSRPMEGVTFSSTPPCICHSTTMGMLQPTMWYALTHYQTCDDDLHMKFYIELESKRNSLVCMKRRPYSHLLRLWAIIPFDICCSFPPACFYGRIGMP